MAVYDPPDQRWRALALRLITPQQVTRSGYTGRRQVSANPWHGRWALSAEHVPIVGQANFLPWRALLAKLRGQENKLKVKVTEAAQHGATYVHKAVLNHQNMTVVSFGDGTYRVTKTAGADGGLNAAVYSAESLAGQLVLMARPQQTNLSLTIGLNASSATANTNQVDIDYQMDFGSDGILRLYVGNGATRTLLSTVGAYATQTRYFLIRTGANLDLYSGASDDHLAAAFVVSFGNVGASLQLDSSFVHLTAAADIRFFDPTESIKAASGGAAGASTLTLNATPALLAGHFATVPLASGGKQLVQLTANLAAGVITFEPPLREAASLGQAVETINPYVEVALESSEAGYSVGPGQQYALTIEASEAY